MESRTRRPALLPAGLLLLALTLTAAASPANEIHFDELPLGSSVAGVPFPGVSILTGVVIDDAELGAIGVGGGPFATTPTQGLYNLSASAVPFVFDAPISRFEIDVVSLPNALPDLLPVLLQAYVGDTPTTYAISNASSSPERLSLFDPGVAIDRVVLFPRVPCSWVSCDTPQDISDVYLDVNASFFADTVAFSAEAPEPGGFALVGGGMLLLGLARRRSRPTLTRRGRSSSAHGHSNRAAGALLALCSLVFLACVPVELRIDSPRDGSRLVFDPSDLVRPIRVEIELGETLPPGGSLKVRLRTGASTFLDVTPGFVISGTRATRTLPGIFLPLGETVVIASVDRDGAGGVEGVASSTFTIEVGEVESVARQWNEVLLDSIRVDTPRPTVHARNLFHLAVAMWDCWVAYDTETAAVPYLFLESHAAADPAAARHACISQAAHRLLRQRFQGSIGAATSIPAIDAKLTELGYDVDFVPAGPSDDSPQAVGYRVGQTVIDYGLADGANEQNDYADPGYTPVNSPLIFGLSGTGGSIRNPNRWAPLAFEFRCFQNEIPVPEGEDTQTFVGSNWNAVTPFALTRSDPSLPYFDPGAPPRVVDYDEGSNQIVGPGELEAKRQLLEVIRYSYGLNPDDAPMINISPGVYGNNSLAGIANGVLDGTGHGVNPSTGLPYPSNWVNQADFGRVIAEFWADGPDSETPPGHWFTLLNEASDHPELEKKIGGVGPEVDDLEWYVKSYLALGGAVHDAAVAAWGAKGIYDYMRPIAGIRWLSEQGQSSDPGLPSYSEYGMLLEDGVAELVTAESSAPGERHEHLADHVGEVALNVWPGEPNRELPPACGDEPAQTDPGSEIPPYSGREWILGKNWITYQRRTFVTPPFAAYVSGHSAFSRAAAEVMARLTGSDYFPGGYGEFIARQNDFLVFETGPTSSVRLQWATWYDAADEAGISRLWGGIHVAADDFEGRLVGSQVGVTAYDLAEDYWTGNVAPGP